MDRDRSGSDNRGQSGGEIRGPRNPGASDDARMGASGRGSDQHMGANGRGQNDRMGNSGRSADMAAGAHEKVSVDMLHDKLSSEGEFTRVDRLGQVFRPRGVDRDWKPYSHGRWIFNDRVGWYFESDEPWAEVTYHYGRWYEDPDQGWVWVAGTEWAPAWVEWRRSKQYVGWRPLPRTMPPSAWPAAAHATRHPAAAVAAEPR